MNDLLSIYLRTSTVVVRSKLIMLPLFYAEEAYKYYQSSCLCQTLTIPL